MITYKNLTLAELKRDYHSHPGFIFHSNSPSSEAAILNLCKTLIDNQITIHYPEFVVKDSGTTTVFVYPLNESFESGRFYKTAQAAMSMGIAKIDTLMGFLQDN